MSAETEFTEGTEDMMTNLDFDKIFTRGYTGVPHKRYGGVLMKDQLNSMNPEDKFYIINLDNSGGGGTHWVLVCNIHNDMCIYFDSFGVPPSDEVVAFMKRARKKNGRKKSLLFNTIQLQEDDAVSCGYYCAYMALQLSRKNKTFVTALADFNLNFETWLNEQLIQKIKKNALFSLIE